MASIYPMKLKAACKDYIWGGTRLRSEYHQQSDAEKIAESWMLSSHPDGPSTIVNGAYAGMTLPEYFKMAGHAVFGTDCDRFPDFPVLIKLIDAKDRLSIQVHPDDAYARAHGGTVRQNGNVVYRGLRTGRKPVLRLRPRHSERGIPKADRKQYA